MNYTILVVDFQARSAEATKAELVQRGFDVIVASNPQELDQLVGSLQAPVVLLEPMLPGLDGFALCRRFRAGHFGSAPQVVLASRLLKGDRYQQLARASDTELFFQRPEQDAEMLMALENLMPDPNTPFGVESAAGSSSGAHAQALGRASNDFEQVLAGAPPLAGEDLDTDIDELFEQLTGHDVTLVGDTPPTISATHAPPSPAPIVAEQAPPPLIENSPAPASDALVEELASALDLQSGVVTSVADAMPTDPNVSSFETEISRPLADSMHDPIRDAGPRSLPAQPRETAPLSDMPALGRAPDLSQVENMVTGAVSDLSWDSREMAAQKAARGPAPVINPMPDKPDRGPKKDHSYLMSVVIGIVIAAALLGGFWYWQQNSVHRNPATDSQSTESAPVTSSAPAAADGP